MPMITIATINIGAASKERARSILDKWLIQVPADVYVLTETSEGQGTELILSEFRNSGWSVFQLPTAPKDRGAAVVTRISASLVTELPPTDPAPGRSVVIDLSTLPPIRLIGMYVPNRGNDWAKTERKEKFLSCWLAYMQGLDSGTRQRILLGDLNVVPNPQHPIFLPQQRFEYDWLAQLQTRAGLRDAAVGLGAGHESTWVAHTGEGYTYDHIFMSAELMSRASHFRYDHSSREDRTITDHSALLVDLQLEEAEQIPVMKPGEQRQTQLF